MRRANWIFRDLATHLYAHSGHSAIEHDLLGQHIRVDLQIRSAATQRRAQERGLRRASFLLWVRNGKGCILPAQKVTTSKVLLNRYTGLFHSSVDVASEDLGKIRMGDMERSSTVESQRIRRKWHARVCSTESRVPRPVCDASREIRKQVIERPGFVTNKICLPRAILLAMLSPKELHRILFRHTRSTRIQTSYLSHEQICF